MNTKKLLVIISTVAFIIAAIALTSLGKSVSNQVKSIPTILSLYDFVKDDDRPKIKVGEIEIAVDVAKTASEKAKGLSGRKSLKDNEGMLFVFENKSRPSFWMKDMLIPIDIIWITDGKIVGIEKNVPPPEKGTSDAKLPLYTPEVPIDHVLEVKAGFCEENRIDVGSTITL